MADTGSAGGNTERPRGWLVLKHHLLTHKVSWPVNCNLVSHNILCWQIELALWFTRLATVICTVGYILPIVGNPYNSYYKVGKHIWLRLLTVFIRTKLSSVPDTCVLFRL